jgi:post-segregation antitoxin (ccd killing protein)
MSANTASPRKRPVNVSLNENLVEQARAYTGNLSATLEALLAGFVAQQQEAGRMRQQWADACAADWNRLDETQGSFADAHSTL